MRLTTPILVSALVASFAPVSWAETERSGAPQPSAVSTWNRIALGAIERAKPSQHQAIRMLAHVSLAQFAALHESAAGHAEPSVIATAAGDVIAALLPSQAAYVAERQRELMMPDSERGRYIARRVIAVAASDGFAQAWGGSLPQAANTWRSLATPPAAPAYPAIGSMRTFLTQPGSVLPSAPPPAFASARFIEDLAEVRRHTASPSEESRRVAKFYDMTTGTLAGGFWNEQAIELIRKHAFDDRRAAKVLATVNGAMMDALVACHAVKYTHWVPRPSQVDPAIQPLIGVPNHPSYPSNHSCLSTAAGEVLAHFFPQEEGRLRATSVQAGLSRIYAGIHYRFDVEAGEDIGRQVAEVAIRRHPQVLARHAQAPISAAR